MKIQFGCLSDLSNNDSIKNHNFTLYSRKQPAIVQKKVKNGNENLDGSAAKMERNRFLSRLAKKNIYLTGSSEVKITSIDNERQAIVNSTPRGPAECLLHLLLDIDEELKRDNVTIQQKNELLKIQAEVEYCFFTTQRRTVHTVKWMFIQIAKSCDQENLISLSTSIKKRIMQLPPSNVDQREYLALYDDALSTRLFESEFFEEILNSKHSGVYQSAECIASYLSEILNQLTIDCKDEIEKNNSPFLLEFKFFFNADWDVEENNEQSILERQDLHVIARGIGNSSRNHSQEIMEDIKKLVELPIKTKFRLLLVPYILTTLPWAIFSYADRRLLDKTFPWYVTQDKFYQCVKKARNRDSEFVDLIKMSKLKEKNSDVGITTGNQPIVLTDTAMKVMAIKNYTRHKASDDYSTHLPNIQEYTLLHGLPFVGDVSGYVLDLLSLISHLRSIGKEINSHNALVLYAANCVHTGSHSVAELMRLAYLLNKCWNLGFNNLGEETDVFDEKYFSEIYSKAIFEDDEKSKSILIDLIKNNRYVPNYMDFLRHFENEKAISLRKTIRNFKKISKYIEKSVM